VILLAILSQNSPGHRSLLLRNQLLSTAVRQWMLVIVRCLPGDEIAIPAAITTNRIAGITDLGIAVWPIDALELRGRRVGQAHGARCFVLHRIPPLLVKMPFRTNGRLIVTPRVPVSSFSFFCPNISSLRP